MNMNDVRTYASLCVYHDEMSAQEMIDVLEYVPDVFNDKFSKEKYKSSACIYSTKNELESGDINDHIDCLRSNLLDVFVKVKANNVCGFTATVSVYWESSSVSGGGPNLDSNHMKFFGELGIDVWFDLWTEQSMGSE